MPVTHAVRLVALALLTAASDAAGRAQSDPSDSDALHEFRIATRRLRTWLRTWRPVLQDGVRRKDERRLRRIAAATGAARDLDMHLKWIDATKRPARAEARASLKAIRAEFDAGRDGARTAVAAAAAELLARRDRLQRRLAVYQVDVRDADAGGSVFALELARRVREAADDLRERLDAVPSPEGAAKIHAARIAAKRLRYLLEPVQDIVRQSAPLITALKSLQDEAGALHDAEVLANAISAATAGAAGVSHLKRRLDAKTGKSYAALETHWLGASATPFFARVRRLAASLATTSGEK